MLALALGEAFKTVVIEGEFIHWNRLYSLGSFLLLILPFYQGMNRYLLVTYGVGGSLPQPYAPFLIIDGAAFMVESALFFVLSRTLRLEEWQKFYWVVFVLLVFDSLWGITIHLHSNTEANAVKPDDPQYITDAHGDRLIPSAFHQPPEAVGQWSPELSTDKPIVVYCIHGHAVSQNAAAGLCAQGFDASFLEGGFAGWVERGLPTRRPSGSRGSDRRSIASHVHG